MKSVKKRIRKSFAPLTVNCNLVCTTIASSPVTQVFDPYDPNSGGSAFQPNRRLSPTVILPDVSINAPDGSWNNPDGNPLLAQMQWYVNGEPIGDYTPWTANLDYSIDTSNTATRGALTIGGLSATDNVNLSASTKLYLSFRAVIADPRTGNNIPIISDEILLSTTDKSYDEYSIAIENDKEISYNPFLDRLLLYEHQVSIGEVQQSAATEASVTDDKCYLKTIPIHVYHGHTLITTGYTLKLFRVGTNNTLTEIEEGDDELLSLSLTEMKLDLRLVDKESYILRAYVTRNGSTVLVASTGLAVGREFPIYRIEPVNGIDIHPEDTLCINLAQVSSRGQNVPHPEIILDINWYTDTDAYTHVKHNEGQNTDFLIRDTGIGNTSSNNWMDIYTESAQKGARSQAIDEDDNILTDEDDNILIF